MASRTAQARPGQPLAAFGAGKVILLGEHGVVFGQPALAGPLSWGVTATAAWAKRCSLDLPPALSKPARNSLNRAFERVAHAVGRPKVRVRLESDLPVSMGLGSSAAVAVACARVLLQAAGKPLEVAAVEALAFSMEREFHGSPSGIDSTTSSRGALIRFRKAPGAKAGQVKPVRSPRPLKLLVALAGPRPSTRDTVASLAARRERWPARYERLIRELGQVATEGVRAVEHGDLEGLGDAMNVNHGLLSALGLSSEGIDAMVHRLRRLGALGAKLTGAGGDGGAVIGLFLEPEPIVAKLTREGIRCFGSQIAGPRTL
jgi:mevalonate kinase